MSRNSDAPLAGLTISEYRALLRTEVEHVVSELRPANDARPQLLTCAELAAALKITTRTLQTLRAKGLPTIMVGDSPRFDYARVLEWCASQR